MLYGDGYQSVRLNDEMIVTFEAIVVDPLRAEPIMWDAYIHGMDAGGGLLLGTVSRHETADGASNYWLHTPAGVIHRVVDPLLGNVADSYDQLVVTPNRTEFEFAIKEWAATVTG